MSMTMTSKVTKEPDALSTARADLTDVSNLLYAAFMAADRLHDENDRRGIMMALLKVIDVKLEIVRIQLDECAKPDKYVQANPEGQESGSLAPNVPPGHGPSGGQPQFSNAWYSSALPVTACAGNATAGRDPRSPACDRGQFAAGRTVHLQKCGRGRIPQMD
jgi:hypothetical protein